MIGFQITSTRLRSEKMPLTIDRRSPRMLMELSYRLVLNSAGWLTVVSSVIALWTAEDTPRPLLHYDYERNKEGYTSAHVQVEATSHAWESVLPSDKALSRLHLPVGGIRYRPTIEDVVEFLGDHRLVDVRGGYPEPGDSGPRAWHSRSRRAAKAFGRISSKRRSGVDLTLLAASSVK